MAYFIIRDANTNAIIRMGGDIPAWELKDDEKMLNSEEAINSDPSVIKKD